MPLSDSKIKAAKPKDKRYSLSDGQALYIEIMPSGLKIWRYRPRKNGIEQRVKLGEYPSMSLAQARAERDQLVGLALQGVIIKDHRREQAEIAAMADTFEGVANEWLEKRKQRWTPDVLDQKRRVLKANVYPVFGHKKIKDVRSADLLKVMQACEDRDAKQIAELSRRIVSQVMCYAVSTLRAEYDIAAPLKGAIQVNPTRHARAHDADMLKLLFQRIKTSRSNRATLIAIELIMLLWQRTREIVWSRWDEVDWENGLLEISQDRMKKRRKQVVPLPLQAIDLLKELHQISGHTEYLFPATKSNSLRPHMERTTPNGALIRMGFNFGEISGHDFRATAKTMLLEAGFNNELLEVNLGHAKRSKTDAAYDHAQYIEKRREVLQWWADYLDTLKTGQ